jgi:dTDP-D-glucose 4,6-dehydratase
MSKIHMTDIAETAQSRWLSHKNFEHGLTETIKWYMDHESWWQPLLERAGRY